MRFWVTNQHNGKKYPAEGQHWPEHGWSAQIHDFAPETWGRDRSGVGTGSVIDQGFQKDLEQRGWVFPALQEPENVRDQMMKKLAASFQPPAAPPKQESLVDKLIPPLDERSQLEIGTELEKEHFRHGKPKDKTPRAVAQTHLGENPSYYPKSQKPKGDSEALRWVKEARPPYRRDPKRDPRLPHTTVLRNRDDLQIPPEAQKVIDAQWPEVVRTFAQYDQGAGMLMLYGCVRDACKAAGWPDNMAYLMRDYLIGKMNKAKVTTYTGSDDRRGEFKKFHMKPEESEAHQMVANLLDHCGHCPEDYAKRGKERMAKLRARRPDLVQAGRI